MRVPFRRALRYARFWTRGVPSIERTETTLSSDGAEFPASVYRPPASGPAPGWVVLHGITRPGRFHASLVRFASSLAASGAVVVVPEVREWVELDLAPHRTFPALRAGLGFLEADGQARGRPGVAGFSFGSPQVIRAALDPGVARRIGAVAAFGGYEDLHRTLRFHFTGTHEWRGRSTTLRPDPYGRWIVVANYLTHVPGFEDHRGVADALRRLAAAAGDLQIDSWDPALDPTKVEVREGLTSAERPLFDFFAPPTDREPIPAGDEVDRWVERLVEAARTANPEVELPAGPIRTSVPIHVVHGESDHLIPVSEGRRLGERLAGSPGSVAITRLFSHSTEHGARSGAWERVRENVRFLRTLDRILSEV